MRHTLGEEQREEPCAAVAVQYDIRRARLERFLEDDRRAGEGFDDGYQSVPVSWGISSVRKRAFFDLVASLSGLEAR